MYSLNEPLKMEKRTRGTNFSFEEKASLLFLVKKHYDVIENKRTDSTTSRYKDQAWEKVTVEFNAGAEIGAERSLKQLRICYENIKRKMKREKNSPFDYYDKNKPKFQKQIPILPKLEAQEPENMLVMVNPDMVPPDPYDSSDMTTASCDGAFTPDQNSVECSPYSSTPIISIQRTSNSSRNATQSQETNIRIVSVDSCAPSSSVPVRVQQREAEPSRAATNNHVNHAALSVHPRLSGITLPSGDVTLAPVVLKERPRPAKAAPSSSSPPLLEPSDGDPECLRLKRKLLRRELHRSKLARRMDVEHHIQQMQLLQSEMRHKEEQAELKRQVLEAKRNYYLSFKSASIDQQPEELEEEQLVGEEEGEQEREEQESPDNLQHVTTSDDEGSH